MNKIMDTFLLPTIIIIIVSQTTSVMAYEVIYAINAGGSAFSDIHNIHYDADPLENRVGTASEFGKQLVISRVPEWDAYLYQTERYHSSSFHYDIPIAGDGEYALVLKFCEVYFNAPNMKIFDVVLNNEHTVVNKLDIFREVGKGVAYDEIIYFTISRGKLYYKNEESKIRSGRIRVEFVKSKYDNPKINALVLYKDDLENIPKLPPVDELLDENLSDIDLPAYTPDTEDHQSHRSQQNSNQEHETKARKTSGPRQQDPYALEDSTVMLPVFIAIGAFIPLLFCLCKL